MDKFEYVVALAAVITGLGLSDVAVSLHRLLKRRAGVAWDWLPVAFALYASLALMRLWYQLWGVRDLPFVTGLPFVAVQVVQTLVLVLVASAALPDEDDFRRGRIDLGAYYARHGRYVWSLYLIFVLMWTATGAGFRIVAGRAFGLLDFAFFGYFLIPMALTVAALFLRHPGQGAILVLLIVHEVLVPSNLFGVRDILLLR